MNEFELALRSRRRFVAGLAGGGLAAALGRSRVATATGVTPHVPTLSGCDFDLTVDALPVNFTGVTRTATVVNASLPAPILRWREGDEINVRVHNRLATPTSIHWHGMLLPADMDGVPGLSFMGIAPGQEFRYRFKLRQSGTYWYHSHSRFQEQTGLFGAIVIEPKADGRVDNARRADRDYVVLLSDWSDTDPEQLYRRLKLQSDYYNYGKSTLSDFMHDAKSNGVEAALQSRRMWNQMRMDASDLADISAASYTYLLNGATPAANWTALFARGESVRLRFINGSSMTFFDVRIPGLGMTVVAADGQDIEPVSVDEFRIGTAETYDVIARPSADRAYTIFAQSMDRSGFARGTLTPHPDLRAEVPALDRRERLSMRDMMGATPMSADMPGMTDAEMAQMPHTAHADTSRGKSMSASAAAIKTGPGVDMTVAVPRTNLDDPGVGLRENGRHVLTYADLHATDAPISTAPEREIELHLTGHMQRYIWSFDGTKFSDAQPLQLRLGERVRITLVNDTMMTHPIHLHGMWSELENERGEFQVRKHTIVVQPAQKLSYRVAADTPGHWAYHCHLLYHMEAGMFRTVVVA